MPRKPKYTFTHTQSGGREIFFSKRGHRKGYPTMMLGIFRPYNWETRKRGKPTLMRKEKRGTWTLPIMTKFTREK